MRRWTGNWKSLRRPPSKQRRSYQTLAALKRYSSRYIPGFGGWVELRDDKLHEQVSGGLPAYVPFVDGDNKLAYITVLDRIAR